MGRPLKSISGGVKKRHCHSTKGEDEVTTMVVVPLDEKSENMALQKAQNAKGIQIVSLTRGGSKGGSPTHSRPGGRGKGEAESTGTVTTGGGQKPVGDISGDHRRQGVQKNAEINLRKKWPRQPYRK